MQNNEEPSKAHPLGFHKFSNQTETLALPFTPRWQEPYRLRHLAGPYPEFLSEIMENLEAKHSKL